MNITDDVGKRMLTALRAASFLKERPSVGHKGQLNGTLAMGVVDVTGWGHGAPRRPFRTVHSLSDSCTSATTFLPCLVQCPPPLA